MVTTHLIHGPCRNNVCLDQGVCKKKYPRRLIKDTKTSDNGYPEYRRRSPNDGGFTADVRGRQVDNSWVVPYNPVLLRIFDAHINLEFCASVKAIKYICKYILKGGDVASYEVTDGKRDEVSTYQNGRYISSSEAAYRIFQNPIHQHSPPVQQLQVHLENGQRVHFDPNNPTGLMNKVGTENVKFCIAVTLNNSHYSHCFIF